MTAYVVVRADLSGADLEADVLDAKIRLLDMGFHIDGILRPESAEEMQSVLHIVREDPTVKALGVSSVKHIECILDELPFRVKVWVVGGALGKPLARPRRKRASS